MKTLLISFLAVIMGSICYAQTITGTVIDKTSRQPIKDAKIQTSDKQSTTTDASGKFTITCHEDITVAVSVVGYSIQRQILNECVGSISFELVERFQELNEIQITANSGEATSTIEVPQSISRISEGEIKRGNGLFMTDAVNTNTPGVTMQGRTTTGGQQFNIRGYGNGTRGTRGVSSNFDGQGTKVYLNGIPVTDAEGITVMDAIDFGSISNVEILKGPSGTIYGNAIAGVVNLETRKAKEGETTISQRTTLGSYGLLRSTTQVAIGTKKSSLLVNYGNLQFEGYMPHTSSKKGFVNITGDFKLSDRQTLSTYVGYSDGYDQRNGELEIDQYETFDYSGNPAYIKNDAHSATNTFVAGVTNGYKFSKWLTNKSSIFGTSQLMDASSAGGWQDKSSLSYGVRSTFDMNFKLSEKVSLKGITGLEVQRTTLNSNFFGMGADSTYLNGYNVITNIRSISSTESTTSNVFTQWTLNLPFDLSATAGIGYNRTDLAVENRIWGLSNNHVGNETPQSYSASYDDMWSPTLALNKTFSEKVSAYVSYYQGYKAPVSSYILVPQINQVNPDLTPEKGTQIEVGTKGFLLKHKLFYTAAVYSTKYSDKMTTVTVQNPENTATLYAYVVNGGSVNNTGVEVLLKYEAISSRDKFVTSLRPFFNLTYSNATYDDYRFETVGTGSLGQDSTIVNDFSGKIVAGLPPLVMNAGIDFETKIGLYANVVVNYRDAMYFTSDNENITEAYTLLNAKLGYQQQFGHFNVDVFAGSTNITSTQYYQMVFVNQLPDAYIPAANDINFFGGLNLSYTF